MLIIVNKIEDIALVRSESLLDEVCHVVCEITVNISLCTDIREEYGNKW